jgi:hypothetical protein
MKIYKGLRYSYLLLSFAVVSACAQNSKPSRPVINESKGTAGASQPRISKTAEQVSYLVATLQSPGNLNELLKNVKFMLDNDLLLQEELFTQPNFERVLAAK